MVVAIVMFGLAAFMPSMLDALDEGRSGRLFRAVRDMNIGPFNIPLALCAAAMAFELVRQVRRMADDIAITATETGLVPHRTTGIAPIAWSEVQDISAAPAKRGEAATLVIRCRNGRAHRIKAVDSRGGVMDEFVREARKLGDLDGT
ncbi:hypothetical protein FHS91_001257 [Sphingobium xanthum]|uniref:hypothetical protein n=1 Tax=Sphingobium xanthum TaxID=1387165 RepID=UPI001C8B3D4B|nr:hypothetical protein [Sphingobium xanthum]